MALKSRLFRGDPKLEHVLKIQLALTLLDGANIAQDGAYGSETAASVLAYKKKRNIINRAYQTTADNIVGIMTMAALDKEMSEKERYAPTLARTSNGTCVRVAGSTPFPVPSPVLPNPYVVMLTVSLVPQIRIAITAADFHLTGVGPHVTNHRQTLPPGLFNEQARASLRLLDKVFGFSVVRQSASGVRESAHGLPQHGRGAEPKLRDRPVNRSYAFRRQCIRRDGTEGGRLYICGRRIRRR